MSRARTPISSRKGIKISDRTRKSYKKALAEKPVRDSDAPMLPPERWATAMRKEEFFRPIKKLITVRLDADVLHWLKSAGEGYQPRLNAILREAMERETGVR